MKKSLSMRTKLFLLMALLVILQSLALVFALSASKVLLRLDAEAFRLFKNTTSAQVQTFDASIGQLVNRMAGETELLNETFQMLSAGQGVPLEELYLNDEAYKIAAMEGGASLMNLLASNNITGAFFILNGSNADKTDPAAHSAVYIRNSAPSAAAQDTSNYQLEIGPAAVAQQNKITSSLDWNLDTRFNPNPENPLQYQFYEQPIAAAETYRNAEMERYGYWSPPVDILNDKQPVVSYTMPLLDKYGSAYGVLGIEMSIPCFTQYYLPNEELPFDNGFYIIAPVQEDELMLDWYVSGNPAASMYLKQGEALHLSEIREVGLHQADLAGLGKVFCSVQPLTMYSQNSPFIEENWSLVGFVPVAAMHESSAGVRFTLLLSIVTTTLVSFAAIFLLVHIATRKITRLSKYMEGVSPYQAIHFERSGMREIDELTSAVEMLNKSVISAASTTSKILELTLLPIGGFEVSEESGHVVLTEYTYELLGMKPGAAVPKEDWNRIFGELTAHPATGRENIYQYETRDTGEERWLRILRAPTPGGYVGVVLDVTRDIEENRRLTRELDFDIMTRLFNRNAFKREVHTNIHDAPEKMGAMVFADLDNLKYINDTFGHDTGDQLIMRAGEMFHEFTKYGGLVARISGDEYAVYLHGFDSKEEIREIIHGQYRRNLSFSLVTPDGEAQRIRCSSGVAWYPGDASDAADLLKLADYAMYEAKHKEKGAIFEFCAASYNQNFYLLENREAINRLLDERLIRFAFQPIVNLKTGQVFAYEALMRPMLENFKSPLEILKVAAAQSKLSHLERLIIFAAFDEVAARVNQLGDSMMFINSIPSQILAAGDLDILRRRYRHVFDRVVVEITEAENDSPERLDEKVRSIRGCGMQLAVDDFGSGYSNEVRILSIQPDLVKLDMELIQGIHISRDKQQLVQNIASFCHPKGIRLIAEGVESVEDLAQVIHMGVDYVQGYYTGRPDFEILPIPEAIRQEILSLQDQDRL